MYVAAPMPNSPAVPPLYVPGGVDTYGFYVLSAHSAMAPDTLQDLASDTASPPHDEGASSADLVEEAAYWEESFRMYLGLCAVADQVAERDAVAARMTDAARRTCDPLTPRSEDGLHTAAPSVTRRGDENNDDPLQCPRDTTTTPIHAARVSCTSSIAATPTPSVPLHQPATPRGASIHYASRLRVPVTSVVAAAEAVALSRNAASATEVDTAGGSPDSRTNTMTLPALLPVTASLNAAPHLPTVLRILSTCPNEPTHMTGDSALQRLSLSTVHAALTHIERDWENHLYARPPCAHGELRRLLWSFWSGATHRSAEVQDAADALYRTLVADDDDAAGAPNATGAHAGLRVAPLGHEEAETINRDLSRTFPTHCLFTAAATALTPAHLAERPAFLFSPNARAAAAAAAAKKPGGEPAHDVASVTKDTASPDALQMLTVAVGQAELNRLLRAYCRLDPEVGYCQGMSFVAAVLLLHAPEVEAFQMFYCLLQNPVHSLRDLYAPHFGFLHTLVQTLDRQVHQLLPVLHRHLQQEGVLVEYFAASWFLTLFATHLPLALVVHLWDWFLLKGWSVMLQAAVAVLQWRQDELLLMDMEAILLTLKDLRTASYPCALAGTRPRTSLLTSTTSTSAGAAGLATHTDLRTTTADGTAASAKTVSPSASTARTAHVMHSRSASHTALTAASTTNTVGATATAGHNAANHAPPAGSGETSDDDGLTYRNEPAVPAQSPAVNERTTTPEDMAEAIRRILEVPIDMDDVPSLW